MPQSQLLRLLHPLSMTTPMKSMSLMTPSYIIRSSLFPHLQTIWMDPLHSTNMALQFVIPSGGRGIIISLVLHFGTVVGGDLTLLSIGMAAYA